MIEQKKRSAAATVERQTTKVAVCKDTFSVSQAVKACKRFVCQLGCFFAALTAFMFFCAPLDPGEMSLSAGWALAATAAWLCSALYHMAEGSEQDG